MSTDVSLFTSHLIHKAVTMWRQDGKKNERDPSRGLLGLDSV